MLLVQHDTDQLTFDEMVKLSITLTSKIQLANQNRLKNYNSVFFSNNIYIPPTLSINNHGPAQHQVTTIYITFAQPQLDQNDFINFSTTNKKPRKPLTAEQKKYRFENNLCLYCGKPGHKAFDHKFSRFTQRVNFVSEVPVLPPPSQLTIENPQTTNQRKA